MVGPGGEWVRCAGERARVRGAGGARRPHPAQPRPTVAALRAFDAAVGDPGLRLSSWRATDPCGEPDCAVGACHWAGIACARWRVVEVNLSCTPPSCAPLRGGPAALASLWHLSDVVEIDVSGNALRGRPPVGPLPHGLQTLDLGSNRDLGGALPPAWGASASLQYLSLAGTGARGGLPPEWAPLGATLKRVSLRDACGVCGPWPPWLDDVAVDGVGSGLGAPCGPSGGGGCGRELGPGAAVQLAGATAAASCLAILIVLRRGIGPHDSSTGPPRGWARARACLFGSTAPPDPGIALAVAPAVDPGPPPTPKTPAPPPALVVGPDGETVSFALRLTPVDDGRDGDRSSDSCSRAASPVGRRGYGDLEAGRSGA